MGSMGLTHQIDKTRNIGQMGQKGAGELNWSYDQMSWLDHKGQMVKMGQIGQMGQKCQIGQKSHQTIMDQMANGSI